MSIQRAAYRLALAVRDERDNRHTADGRLRGHLEDEVDMALRAVDEALSPRWDGSDPCRACGGSRVLTSPVDRAPCGDCAGTGKKGVLAHRVAA